MAPARKPISDARTATYVIFPTGSGPGGQWFKSTRPDHFSSFLSSDYAFTLQRRPIEFVAHVAQVGLVPRRRLPINRSRGPLFLPTPVGTPYPQLTASHSVRTCPGCRVQARNQSEVAALRSFRVRIVRIYGRRGNEPCPGFESKQFCDADSGHHKQNHGNPVNRPFATFDDMDDFLGREFSSPCSCRIGVPCANQVAAPTEARTAT